MENGVAGRPEWDYTPRNQHPAPLLKLRKPIGINVNGQVLSPRRVHSAWQQSLNKISQPRIISAWNSSVGIQYADKISTTQKNPKEHGMEYAKGKRLLGRDMFWESLRPSHREQQGEWKHHLGENSQQKHRKHRSSESMEGSKLRKRTASWVESLSKPTNEPAQTAQTAQSAQMKSPRRAPEPQSVPTNLPLSTNEPSEFGNEFFTPRGVGSKDTVDQSGTSSKEVTIPSKETTLSSTEATVTCDGNGAASKEATTLTTDGITPKLLSTCVRFSGSGFGLSPKDKTGLHQKLTHTTFLDTLRGNAQELRGNSQDAKPPMSFTVGKKEEVKSARLSSHREAARIHNHASKYFYHALRA